MRRAIISSSVGLLILSILNSNADQIPALAAPNKESKPEQAKSAASKSALSKSEEGNSAQTKSASKQNLHRADFRVTGASCVACLRRIGKTIRDQKGVLKADVSIFKPYWAIVIYEADQTNMEKIFDCVKHEKVKFEDIEDKSISALPLIVIPKGINKPDSAGTPVSSSH